MERSYQHLSDQERAAIMIQAGEGHSARSIARSLGRHVSTVSRELARGQNEVGSYCATRAAGAYRQRRRRSGRPRKLVPGTWLHQWVQDRLCLFRWSPEQIAGRLRRRYPEQPSRHVSHETIYAAIYAHPKGELRKALTEALRQEKPTRGRRRRSAAKGGSIAPEELSIAYRPEDIDSRLLPGHWEGDLIKGAGNRSAVGTIVERKTRYVVLSRMRGSSAEAALEGFTRQMKHVPAQMRQSLTYDRGSEMARHAELARRLKLDIWFADPYAPWQRGSNEPG